MIIKRQLSPEGSHSSFMDRFVDKDDKPVAELEPKPEENQEKPGQRDDNTQLFDQDKPDEEIQVGSQKATELSDDGMESLFGKPENVDPEKQKLLELQAAAKQMEHLKPFLDDPLVQMAINFRQAGKNDYNEFIENLAGPNINSQDREQVYSFYLRNKKKVKDDVTYDLLMRQFGELPEEAQKEEIENITTSHFEARQEKLKGYNLSLLDEAAQREIHRKHAHKALGDYSKAMLNKSIKGFIITPEINAEINKEVQDGFAYYDTRPDGGYKVEDSYLLALFKKYGSDMFNLIEKNAFERGKLEVAEKVVNANANTTPRTSTQSKGLTQEMEDNEAVSALIKERRERAK